MTPGRSPASVYSTWPLKPRGDARTTVPDTDRDMIDATFVVGSLVRPAVEDEPDEPPQDVAALLDEAEDIVSAAGPAVVAEVESQRSGRRWWQVWKRRDDDDGFHLSNR